MTPQMPNAMVSRLLRRHLPIIGLALLLLAPTIFCRPFLQDSFWIDWVWSDQFTAELARGNLYPRWFPLANGGAGSPTFYFYPPLAFYVSGLLGLIGLPTYASVIGCFAVGLVASGYAMLAWLKNARYPLIGALVFMAAPYHLLDFYGRGAQAEFLAISLIPLVALGLRRVEGSRPTLLSFAYAGLILTHLPLALLTSLFFIAPYCIWYGRPWRYALPLALGIAMAAIYLIPALALDHYRHSEILWADPRFQPKNWSLIFPREGPLRAMRNVFATTLIASLLPTGVLWFAGQRRAAGYAASISLVAAGIVPALWALPILRDVQFPFRLLPLIEFAISTGIASVRLSQRMLLVALCPVLILTPVFVLVHQQEHVPTITWLAAFHPDVAENQLIRHGPLPAWPERLGLAISLVGLAGAAANGLRRRVPESLFSRSPEHHPSAAP